MRISVLVYNIRMETYSVAQDWSYIEQDHKRVLREMTLPDERYRAVLMAERLLRDLCNPRETPRVPRLVRDRARAALRHFPSEMDMFYAARAAPNVFAERLEDVQRFIMRGANQLDEGEKS